MARRKSLHCWLVVLIFAFADCLWPASPANLRLGIIGTDSTHAVEFTRILNDESAPDHVMGARIVAAYRGGNPAFPLSRDRIGAITAKLIQRWHIPFVARIHDLCSRVDGILLLSVDPEDRETEFESAAACHKPIFVDKPLAPTLQEAQRLVQFAGIHHVEWFSSSAMRFVIPQTSGKEVLGAEVWGPGALGSNYPLDLSWYGIHSIEALYAIMGPGVRSVARIHSGSADVITAVWRDGRVGVVNLLRPDFEFGSAIFQSDGHSQVQQNIPIRYAPLLNAVVAFMRGGAVPVTSQETLEIFAFMEAAQRSMRHNGTPEQVVVIKVK